MLSPRYTSFQREAVSLAYALPGVTAGRVSQQAAAGGLEHPSGARLRVFDIPENTVRSIAGRERRKQAADEAALGLLEMPPRTAVEVMRCRLLTVMDSELDRIEIEQGEGRPVSGEVLRQVARAARELASIPGPNDPRPPRPGAKVNGVRDGSETRGGLAGAVVQSSRSARLQPNASTGAA